jgi:Holliday junction DNA helicase RuvA
MFNSIIGTITGKSGDSCFIDTGGVEWDVSMPLTDLADIGELGSQGRVYTYLIHKEDAMKLYGFASAERRITFLELIKVEGIGPKGAIKIMGGIGQAELEEALETENLARLESVPGLGKKTAQKMLLALKGKLVKASGLPPAKASPYADIVDSLVGMGYERRLVQDAIAKADNEVDKAIQGQAREQHLFKTAIMHLSLGM